MTPTNPASFTHRKEKLSTGNTYHFIDEYTGNSPATATTLLCIHGWPDFWYGWRHQIRPWANQGWRVVVPDMLGYGETDKPSDLKLYGMKFLCADLAALLDLLGVKKAVIIGHDWGSVTAWRFALWHPDRILGVVNLSIPYYPPPQKYVPLEEIVKNYPFFGYQLYLAEEKTPKELESNLHALFNLIYQVPGSSSYRPVFKPGQLRSAIFAGNVEQSPIWNEEEMQYYLSTFREGGLRGPLSYYRTTKIRFEEDQGWPSDLPKNVPWLFIWGTHDRSCSPTHVEGTRKFVPQLEEVRLDGVGHWVMLERKELIRDKISQFISENIVPKLSKL